MFNYREVREQVTAKLNVIKRVDEEVIHDQYAKALAEHAKKAESYIDVLQKKLEKVCARHPEKPWVMIDRAEWAEVKRAAEDLRTSLRA